MIIDNEKKRKIFSSMLIQYRMNAGYSSSFEAGREIGAGRDTIHKYEKGLSVPTLSMLYNLMNLYKLQKEDRHQLLSLREEILKK